MAASGTNYAQRELGLSWRRLHLFGIHYVWLIFMQTFIGMALSSGSRWAQAMAALGMVALSARLAAWMA